MRLVGTTGGGQYVERLTDEGSRLYSYSVDDHAVMIGLGIQDYRSTLAVRGDGADACVVDWTGEWEQVGGVPVSESAAAVTGMYRGSLDNIRL